jgi:methyl-accepting chemotaxis protein
MNSQMTIGKKLILCFSVVLLITLVLAITSLNAINKLSGSLDTAVNRTVKKIGLINAISSARSDMLAGQRGVVMFTFGKSPEGAGKAKQLFESSAGKWANALSQLQPLLVTEEAKRSANQLEDALASWRSAFSQIEQLTASGNADAALKIAVEKGVPIYEAAGRDSQRVQEMQTGLLEKDSQAAADISSTSRWTAFALIGLSLAFGVGILWVVRHINASLRQAVTELGEGSEQTASAASQVSSSSQSLAQGASEQAASLEETSASSEEINSMARKNTENSQAASVEMVKAAQLVAGANTQLEEMVASMKDITDSSSKISKIIKVIDEIAFQTNILALNAAVEAARAGEAGMGFAVVAEEVRNLAQRSAQAAKDTATLIEESIEKSTIGSRNLDVVAEGIKTITASTTQVKTLVDEVNLGSQEQARGIEQIAKAITQMEQVTQKTAANAEESASAAEELNAQSETLKDIVERLTAMVGGGEAGSGNARQAQRRNSKASVPRRQGESAAGLAALRNAVSHQLKSEPSGPALAGRASRKDAFPLEEQFKEF